MRKKRRTMPFQKSIGRRISAMNSGKIIAPPYAKTICMIPLTLENSGRLTKTAVAMGPSLIPYAAVADLKFGGECATTPIVCCQNVSSCAKKGFGETLTMKMTKRLSQTALQN